MTPQQAKAYLDILFASYEAERLTEEATEAMREREANEDMHML